MDAMTPSCQSVLEELGAALLESDEPPGRITFTRTVGLAKEWHASGGEAGDLVRELARLGRLLEDAVPETTLSSAQRLQGVVAEATAQALDALTGARRVRRDRWLSYFCHEMRNYMNTLVNAHWILKNAASTPQQQRVCDMADRAVKKMESAVKDLRDMEQRAREPAPGRPDDMVDGIPHVGA